MNRDVHSSPAMHKVEGETHFLAALSSSRSVVVRPLVRPSVGWSVRHLGEKTKKQFFLTKLKNSNCRAQTIAMRIILLFPRLSGWVRSTNRIVPDFAMAFKLKH